MSETKPPAPLGFFQTVNQAIFSPGFYQSMPQRTFGQALWYMLRLTMLLVLGLSLVLVVPLAKNWGTIKAGVEEFENIYPAELVLTLEDGSLSTNVEEPYVIPLPKSLTENEDWDQEEMPQNLVVIDTSSDFSIDKMEEYNTLAWVTDNSFYMYTEADGKVEAESFKDAPDAVIDKSKVDELTATLSGAFFGILVAFALFMYVIMVILLVIGRLIFNVVLAFFGWVLAQMMNVKHDYGTSYVATMYAMTSSVVISMIMVWLSEWTGVVMGDVPFLFTGITLVVLGLNYSKMEKPIEKKPSEK
jgi:hypothetical protein